jgi:hypothetical protein
MAEERRFITRIGGYAIDCVVNETHGRESEVTAFPVESGADVNDNVKRKGKTLSLEGIVSDTPVGDIAVERQFRSGPPVLASKDAMLVLENFWATGAPITIETATQTYKNMVLAKFDVPIDAETGAALRFTGAFVELRIRNAERVVLLVRADVRGKKKTAPKNKPIDYRLGEAFEKKELEDALPNDRFDEDGRLTNDKLRRDPNSVSHVRDAIQPSRVQDNLPWWANVLPGAQGLGSVVDGL